MARIRERHLAIELRKQGKTYSEIKKQLGTAKSTLSDWLSTYPLTQKQLLLLKEERIIKRALANEKTTITKYKKRQERLTNIYQREKKRLSLLTNKELEIAGLFLYWGEGVKNLQGSISINNTDPLVLKFVLFWYIKSLSIPKEKIKVNLHLYNDMNVKFEMDFWSQELAIPLTQFNKPYIKKSTRNMINQKGFGHGTCGLCVNDVRLKEQILMGIKAIAEHYSKQIKAML